MEEKSINPLYANTQRKKDDEEIMKELRTNHRIEFEVIPDLISFIAWYYADRVFKYCSANKIAAVKKLTQVSKMLQRDYQELLVKKVGISRARKNWVVLDTILSDMDSEFMILWFTVNGQFKKEHPNEAHDTMRTDAIICMLFIKMLSKHIIKIDKMAHDAGLSATNNILMNKHVRALQELMQGYIGDMEIITNEHTDRSLLIIGRLIRNLQFE